MSRTELHSADLASADLSSAILCSANLISAAHPNFDPAERLDMGRNS